jgi:hypothetical protein
MKKLFTKMLALVVLSLVGIMSVGAQTTTYSGTFPIYMQTFTQVYTTPVGAGWAGSTSAPSTVARDGKCFTTSPAESNFNSARNITYRLPNCGTITLQANGTVGRGFIVTVKKVSDASQVSRTVWAYANGTCSTQDFVVNINEPVNVTILSPTAVEGAITATGSSYISSVNITQYVATTPSIVTFTVGGIAATVNDVAGTIIAELPYGTDLTNITPTVTVGGTATGYAPSGAQNFSAGAVTYTATDGTNTKNYAVTLTASATPSSDKDLSALLIGGYTPVFNSGTNTYSIVLPKASSLTQAITFTKPLTATANFTSGNTADLTTPLDIIVTAQDNSTKTFHIQTTVGSRNIAYVTAAGNNDPYLHTSLINSGYYVEDVIAGTQTASYFANHDLVILFDIVSSSNTLALNMKDLIGTKRFLNLKAFMYGKTGWPTGTGVNVAGERVATIGTNYISHPIFSGLTLADADATLVEATVSGNGLQGVTTLGAGTTIAVLKDNPAAACIIEDNTVQSAMYLMIGYSNGATYALANINADGKKLLYNAVSYLLEDTRYVPTATGLSQNKISGVTFDGQIIRNASNLDLQVFDATGRKVVNSNRDIDMSSNSKGIYFVKSNAGTFKIIVNK